MPPLVDPHCHLFMVKVDFLVPDKHSVESIESTMDYAESLRKPKQIVGTETTEEVILRIFKELKVIVFHSVVITK